MKSGGAILFGERIGFNYNLEANSIILLEELIDISRTEELEKNLSEAFQDKFTTDLGEEVEIPITDNYYLTEEGITFVYQRFEHKFAGGAGLDLTIPYCDLEGLLINNTILSKNLK